MFRRKKTKNPELTIDLSMPDKVSLLPQEREPLSTPESANEYSAMGPFNKDIEPTTPEQKFQADLIAKARAFASMGNIIQDRVMSSLSPEELAEIEVPNLFVGYKPIAQLGTVEVEAKPPLPYPGSPVQLQLLHNGIRVELSAKHTDEGTSVSTIFRTKSDNGEAQRLLISVDETPEAINTSAYNGDYVIGRLGSRIDTFKSANEVLGVLADAAGIDFSEVKQ